MSVTLNKVRIRHFRNIIDSGDVDIDPEMTCLVGKNEAGKSAVLQAIHALNPLKPPVTLTYPKDYPQWLWKRHQRAGTLGDQPMVVGTYTLDDDLVSHIEDEFGPSILSSRDFSRSIYYPRDGLEQTFRLAINEPAFVRYFLTRHELTGTLEDPTLAALRAKVDEAESPQGEAARRELDELLGERGLLQTVYDRIHRRLPRSIYFSEYAQLDGEYSLPAVLAEVASPDDGATETLRTAADFLRLAQVDPEGAEADDYVEMTAELRAVSNELTTEMRTFWSQSSDVALKVDIDKRARQANQNQQVVDRFLRFEIDDTSHGFQTNLDRRSTGFRWFVSFMAAFFEHRNDANVLLLLDEPGLSLHARAQTDLLQAIEDRVAESRQTVYTTHSPFMVRPHALDQVRIVEDHGPEDGGGVVTDQIVATDRDTLFPLQAALGYDLAMNLFIGPHNVIVEGVSDYIYLNYFRARQTREDAEVALRDSATLLPTRGVTKIPAFLALLGRPQLEIVVVVDGDAPDQGLRRATERGLVRPEAVVCIGNHALRDRTNGDIEDLFDTANYLRIFNSCYGTDYEAGDLPPGDRIVKRLEALHGDFSHGEVAEHFLQNVETLAPNATTAGRFRDLLLAIDEALGN